MEKSIENDQIYCERRVNLTPFLHLFFFWKSYRLQSHTFWYYYISSIVKWQREF